jgi:hypothetical protein
LLKERFARQPTTAPISRSRSDQDEGMIAMIDEIFDRQYQAGRNELNAGLDRAFATIGREVGKSLAAVHRFEWSAPWARKPVASKDITCA